MSIGGTRAYGHAPDVPDLVRNAVAAARALGFELCVRPEIGRLLAVLAAGLPPGALVGETGTGTGAGLAWMISAAPTDTRFVSYELDADRATAAKAVFERHPLVEIVHGDAGELFERGPFDLLVHDGGPGSGKRTGDRLVDPRRVLRPGGTMTVDDWTPTSAWPPTHDGRPDAGRIALFGHPDLRTTELRVAADLAVVVARWFPSGNSGAGVDVEPS